MNINTPPKIITTIPRNYAIDVATNLSTLAIGFGTDLDAASIEGNIRLSSKEGVPVPVSLKYEYRTITVTIRQLLSPNTQYQLMVFGDGNLDDSGNTGVRSALGIAMQGNAIISFSTMKSDSLMAPIGKHPLDKSIIETAPAFNWELSEGAIRYEIQVSTSNTMSPMHWSSANIAAPPVYPSVPLGESVYYWRIRAIDKYQKVSEWSPIYIFNLDTVKESPLTPEDTLAPELSYNKLDTVDDGYVEFLESFPQDNFTNVKDNLKTVYFTVLGVVTEEDISVEMIGQSVTGEDNDHGIVSGTFEVIPQLNGTTMIAYTPAVLQN
jgi:hypothetical protein